MKRAIVVFLVILMLLGATVAWNAYRIRRAPTDTTWEKVYSRFSSDLLRSPDGYRAAVFSLVEEPALVFIDSEGKTLRSFSRNDLGIPGDEPSLSPLFWFDDTVWAEAHVGLSLTRLVSVDSETGDIQAHDVSSLGVTHDFELRPESASIVASTYASPLEWDGISVPKQAVSLFVYRLDDKTKHELATVSTSEPLAPRWIDADTVEYRVDGNAISVDL